MPDDGRWRMEEQAYRNRVSWMMFLLSILVIWVHSYNVELFAGGALGSFLGVCGLAGGFFIGDRGADCSSRLLSSVFLPVF